MRLTVTIGSESTGIPKPPADIVAEAVRAEQAGHRSAWCTHFSRGIDSLTTLAATAAATSTIELGVGVVPTAPRHPMALAQSAATIQALASGRFVLGVGVSHRPVIEGMHGLGYSDPLGRMREYLTVLGPLLEGEEVTFSGKYYTANGIFTVPGASHVPVIVGALATGMSELGGELADGVTTWLAGPRSLEEVVVPAVMRGAARSGREHPRIIAAVPVGVAANVTRGHDAAKRVFSRYGALPNYRRLLEREGVSEPAELAIVGPETSIRAEFKRLFDAGATDVWAVPFDAGVGLEPTQRLLESLLD